MTIDLHSFLESKYSKEYTASEKETVMDYSCNEKWNVDPRQSNGVDQADEIDVDYVCEFVDGMNDTDYIAYEPAPLCSNENNLDDERDVESVSTSSSNDTGCPRISSDHENYFLQKYEQKNY